MKYFTSGDIFTNFKGQLALLGFFISLAPANLVDVVGLNNLNIAYGIATTFAGAALLVSSPFYGQYIHSRIIFIIYSGLSLL